MSGRRPPWARLALSAVALAACSTSPHSPVRAVSGSVATTTTTMATPASSVPPSSTADVAPPATTPPAVTTSPGSTLTPYSGVVTAVAASDLGASWHDGCPLAPDQLRMVKLGYWGFDGQPHEGAVVVNVALTDAAISVFGRLYADQFPIRSLRPIDAFGGDDDASMAADNTSGFNCRTAVAPGPPQWSAHAYGQAIDVNPVENPYVQGADVLPPAGADYVDRSNDRPGMAVPGGPLTEAFASAGWSWGGRWSSADYQHFSSTGG